MRNCSECNAPTPGPRFSRCEPCRRERLRIQNRDAHRRKAATKKLRACVGCSSQFYSKSGRSTRCTACKHEHRKAYTRAWAASNPETGRAYTRKWRAENPERYAAQMRKGQRKRYGVMNPTDEMRSGPCQVCGEHQEKLFLDHDHATGGFRGWLCIRCNTGLGMFRDNPESLRRAIEYLTAARAQSLPTSPQPTEPTINAA